jgi:hypothetical protein
VAFVLNPIVFVQGAGVLKFRAVGRADDFFKVTPNTCVALSIAHATCHPSGAWNLEAVPIIFEDLCNPVLSVVVQSCVNCSRVDAHTCRSIIVITVVASILLQFSN